MSSILESIYVLAFTKSCRGYNEDELINKESFFFKVRGLLKKDHEFLRPEGSFVPSVESGKAERQAAEPSSLF